MKKKTKYNLSIAQIGYPCNWRGWFDNIKHIPFWIKNMWYRIRFGVTEADAWNLDCYIARVIENGTKILEKNTHSYPDKNGIKTPQDWHNILMDIILFAEQYNTQPWEPIFYDENGVRQYSEEETHHLLNYASEQSKKNREKLFELLSKWFPDLWD